jgi:hypothetical protein
VLRPADDTLFVDDFTNQLSLDFGSTYIYKWYGYIHVVDDRTGAEELIDVNSNKVVIDPTGHYVNITTVPMRGNSYYSIIVETTCFTTWRHVLLFPGTSFGSWDFWVTGASGCAHRASV